MSPGRRGDIDFFVRVYVRAIYIKGGISGCRPEGIQFKGGIMPTVNGLHGNFFKIPTLKIGTFLRLPVNKIKVTP